MIGISTSWCNARQIFQSHKRLRYIIIFRNIKFPLKMQVCSFVKLSDTIKISRWTWECNFMIRYRATFFLFANFQLTSILFSFHFQLLCIDFYKKIKRFCFEYLHPPRSPNAIFDWIPNVECFASFSCIDSGRDTPCKKSVASEKKNKKTKCSIFVRLQVKKFAARKQRKKKNLLTLCNSEVWTNLRTKKNFWSWHNRTTMFFQVCRQKHA